MWVPLRQDRRGRPRSPRSPTWIDPQPSPPRRRRDPAAGLAAVCARAGDARAARSRLCAPRAAGRRPRPDAGRLQRTPTSRRTGSGSCGAAHHAQHGPQLRPGRRRMDVRSEIAEFFNRDGRIDYPSSDVRFLPDEVIFTRARARARDGSGGARRRRNRASSCPGRAGSTTGSSSAPASASSNSRRRPQVSCPTRRNWIDCSPRAASRRSSSTTPTTRRGGSTRAPSSRIW